ncbi:MAG: TetR/AcrR family transcriptional regulator [Streptosporangiaceae bacterium]
MLACMSSPGVSDDEPVPTNQRIRAAAIYLFARRGFAAVGIRDIAARAQITTSVIYHYVLNKDELLVDIMRIGLRSLVASATAAVSTRSDPIDRLAALIVNHMAIEVRQSDTSSVVDHDFRLLGGPQREEILSIRDEYERLWERVLADGGEAGLLDVADARLTRLFCIDMCNGVRRWYRPDGRLSLERVCSTAVDFIFSAVKAQRDGVSMTFDRATNWPPGYLSEFIASYEGCYEEAARSVQPVRSSDTK